MKYLLAEDLTLVAFHQEAQHGTRAAGSGVGAAGADGGVASEWVKCPRVLSAKRRQMENGEQH